MAEFLLDTNHASKLMAREEPVTSRISHSEGNRFGISMTVLAELYYAVHASRHYERNLRRLRTMASALLIWPFDEAAAEEFGRMQAEQKSAGLLIPPLDAQIAAVARSRGLAILTSDHHFRFISGLDVDDWQS
ncbi:MAG: type II toxin-antitoxin system VapC family toxin [Rubrobacteraceae bacterium]